MHSQKKLFTYQFWMICISTFASGYALMGLNAVVAVYASDLNYGTSVSGMLSTLFTITACIFRLLGGSASDKFGRRNVTVVGSIVLAVSIIAYGFVTSLPLLCLFRLIQGAGFAMMSVGAATAFVDVIPPERLGEGIGYSALMGTLSGAAAPSISLALIVAYGYLITFSSMGALMVIAAVLTFFFVNYEKKEPYQSERKKALEEATAARDTSVPAVKRAVLQLFEKQALPPALLQSFMGIGFAAANVFIALFAVEQGYVRPGIYFTAMAVFSVLSRVVGGAWADKGRNGLCLYLGLGLCILSYFLLSTSPQEYLFYICGGLYGFGNGLVMPVLNRIAVVGVRADRRGAATSTFTISTDIGTGIGSALWGVVIEVASFQACFMWTTLWLLISVVGCVAFLHYNKKRT